MNFKIEPADVWNYVNDRTLIERHKIKCVVYSLLTGISVIETLIAQGVGLEDVVDIRMNFENAVKQSEDFIQWFEAQP